MLRSPLEPPGLDAYFDFVLRHLEEELTSEQVAAEARFLREADRVILASAGHGVSAATAEDADAAYEAIAARLED